MARRGNPTPDRAGFSHHRTNAAILIVVALVACGGGAGPPTSGRTQPSAVTPDREASARKDAEVLGNRLDRPATLAVTPYERQAFLDVALSPAVAAAKIRPVLQRWVGNPTLRVTGDPTPEDLQRLAESAQRWSLITGRTITVSAASGNVGVHFVHRVDFAPVLRVDHVDPTAVGLTRITVDPNRAGAITGAMVVIADDDAQVGRNRTIAHEIGHVLGLQHSTCASSLMDGSSGDGRSVRWSPSALDTRLASLLYDRRLSPGLDARSVGAILTPTVGTGVTCGPVDLELVRASAGGRRYLCARGPEALRPCTADLSREPGLPIVNPDAWTDGASLIERRPG